MNKLDQQIRRLVLKHVYLEPAAFNRVGRGRLTPEGGQIFVQQFSHFTRNFPRWLAAVASNCDNQEARRFLAANLYEEEVGEEQESHFELLVKQGIALGLTKNEIQWAEPLPTTSLAVRALDEICRSKPWLEGLAATTSLECINDPRLRKQAGVIIMNDIRAWQHLNLPSRALRSRTIHLEGDESHVREGLSILLRHANTVKTRNAVLKVAKLAVFAFRTLMEGIGQAALNPARSGDERD